MKIPTNLIGGRSFDGRFTRATLREGQQWRKAGPVGALQIVRVMQPGRAGYDGGAPGISVRRTTMGASAVRWERKTWFWPGTEDDLLKVFEAHGLVLAGQL